MTSPEALAAVADIWFVNSDGSEPSRVELADIIDRHFAPLRAERDALALRCAAMEKLLKLWNDADAYCDLSGYLAGEYDEGRCDSPGALLRDSIHEADKAIVPPIGFTEPAQVQT